MASLIKFACVVVMCMALVGAPMVHAVVTCDRVNGYLVPCSKYFQQGGTPSPECCKEFRSIANAACKCLESAVGNIDGYNDNNAVDLPDKCGVTVFYKLSNSTDCDSIV